MKWRSEYFDLDARISAPTNQLVYDLYVGAYPIRDGAIIILLPHQIRALRDLLLVVEPIEKAGSDGKQET